VYWSRLLDWHNQTLTPNPDAVYFMPFYDVSDGPVVLEVPAATEDGAALIGSIMDGWQVPLEDVGAAGVDQGAGGSYLILPPGYDAEVPDGFIPLRSAMTVGFALLRSQIASGQDTDVAAAVQYGLRLRMYPLALANDPPRTTFLDAADVDFDATLTYDDRFFEVLSDFVHAQPWLERDKVMIDVLASLGIVKDSPFVPDEAARQAMTDAAQDARDWLDGQYEDFFAEPFFPGTRWALPATPKLLRAAGVGFDEPDSYPVDARGGAYYWAFSGVKHMGAGQFYLMSTRDSDGEPLHGANDYQVTIPADPPVQRYWSATVYDRQTHALVRDVPYASRASTTQGLRANDDGSVDLHLGPTAAEGDSTNWLPTNPDRDVEVLIRFYGPTPALFEKTWSMPDIAALPDG
jgi:hypothetical protein